MPKIFVIIITYNGARWICNCLGHLANSRSTVEIIVIDNGSTDDTVSLIQKNFPKTLLIKQKANLGFGQANNIGIKYALARDADYVFLLNQDVYVYPTTIDELLFLHERHPDYGIISPLQMNGNGKEIDVLFQKFVSNSYSHKFAEQLVAGQLASFNLLPVRFINATSWFISKSCIEKTGLFDSSFYHYGEDNNYCSRVQYHGYKVGVTPLAAIRHDKVYDLPKKELLLRQIHLVPLCLLLDLRKNVFVILLLIFWKFVGYEWKGISQRSPEIRKCVRKEIKWLFYNFSVIMHNRALSKIPYPHY